MKRGILLGRGVRLERVNLKLLGILNEEVRVFI